MDTNKKNKSSRRQNRIAAMQFLFQWEMNPPERLETELAQFIENREGEKSYYRFTEILVRGAIENIDTIDSMIKEYAQNWDFNRIAKVDLAILRLAIYELLFCPEIPPVVTINEAIELSKIFSTSNASRFINGILDRISLTLKRPLRHPAGD